MKRVVTTLIFTAGLVASPAFAQEVLKEEQATSELRGDWILGGRVTSPEGEMIGSIEDMIIDEEDGRVTAAVVSVGGFLGFGAKQIAVDWSELDIDWDANQIELALTREEAEEADEYVYRSREYEPAPETDMGTGTGTGTTGTTGTGSTY